MYRLFNHYFSVRLLLLTAVEALVLFQSVLIGFELRLGTADLESLPMGGAMIFTALMLGSMTALGLYHSHTEPFQTTVHRVLIAYGMTLMVISVVFYLFPDIYIGRGVMAWSSLIALLGLLLTRLLFFRITDYGLPKRRVLVLGNGSEAENVIRFLHEGAARRSVRYAGLYPVTPENGAFGAEPLNHSTLRRTVAEMRVSEIVVAVRERRGGVLPLRQLLDCKLHGIKVVDLQTFYEREQGILRIDNMRASWMIFGAGFDQGLTREFVKRIFDLAASLLLLLGTLPVLLVAIAAVAIESRGPVFYRQERVGHAGKLFQIIKLRTMCQEAEADGQARWATVNDSRITRVGGWLRRTRIDELPQLWNVLRGDMSFVGPRPERPIFVEQLTEQIPFYDVRHSVKPGITGWSQVRYSYGASVEDGLAKLEYDLYYVKNHSLFLDLMIMIETLQVVLLGKGAR